MEEVKELREIIADMAIEMAKLKKDLKASQLLERYYSDCYHKEIVKKAEEVFPIDVALYGDRERIDF